jgi:hypothetical protein
MISRDYHFMYHSAYYIVYHRFLPKTYTKKNSIKGCCFCCCCFQCNFPYLIVGIRAWSAGVPRFSWICWKYSVWCFKRYQWRVFINSNGFIEPVHSLRICFSWQNSHKYSVCIIYAILCQKKVTQEDSYDRLIK